MADSTNLFQQVTQQIIEQLENGAPPWRRPWATIGGGMPSNAVSKRPYRGVNVLLLWGKSQSEGYESSLWGTFNQWKNLGGHVERGQKGTRIVFWKVVTEETTHPHTGEKQEDKRFFARQYTVFNLDQCGGESLDRFRITRPVRDFTDFEPAEKAIIATGAEIRHGGNRAYYDLSADYITLPTKEAFQGEASYYSTTLHELVHWTGHEDRLNRLDKLSRFGSESYAAEELVAELGASFLSAALGISNAPIQDNAAYLDDWLKVLRADSRAIFTASSAASHAANHILSFSQIETPETIEEFAEIPF